MPSPLHQFGNENVMEGSMNELKFHDALQINDRDSAVVVRLQ